MEMHDLQEAKLANQYHVVFAYNVPYADILNNRDSVPFIDMKSGVLVLSADPADYDRMHDEELRKHVKWSIELAGSEQGINQFLKTNFPGWKGQIHKSDVWPDENVQMAARAAKRITEAKYYRRHDLADVEKRYMEIANNWAEQKDVGIDWVSQDDPDHVSAMVWAHHITDENHFRSVIDKFLKDNGAPYDELHYIEDQDDDDHDDEHHYGWTGVVTYSDNKGRGGESQGAVEAHRFRRQIREAKYAARQITIMITTDRLFLVENMLYDTSTLIDVFQIGNEYEITYGERYVDDILGHRHDSFPLIRIKDGYAHAIPTSHGKPDFVIHEESFDQAIKEKWIEITDP